MTATSEKFGSIGGFESLLDDSYIFESMRLQDYPRFVTKTVQLLGNNSGLKLRFAKCAEESCFNPMTKVVTIPAPPAYPEKKSGMEKFKVELSRWRGVLNHEVGHAQYTLWKTDLKAKEINKREKTYPKEHHMFNDLFENGRMERVACKEYPGMIRDLQKLEGFLGEIIKKMHDEKPEGFNYIYYALRMVVNGYEPVVAIPEHLQEDWEKVKEMAKDAWDIEDEEETYKIAQEISDYLKERHEEEMDKLDEAMSEEDKLKEKLEKMQELQDALENGDDVEFGEAPENGEGGIELDIEGMGGGEGAETEENDGEESEEGQGGASGDESSDEEEGDSKGSGDESSDEKGEDKEEGEDSDSKDSEEEEKDGEGEKDKSEEIAELEKQIEEKKKELEKALKERMAQEARAKELDSSDADPVDPTKEFSDKHQDDGRPRYSGNEVIPLPLHDYVQNVDVEPGRHKSRTKKLLDECLVSVAGMAQRFIQKVRSRVHVGTRTFKGRVNRRKLHKYKYDKNIFKTQSLRKKKDASVMIIVDCSGSMGGDKIQTARKAALVIGEMMHKGKVEFEVRGFTIPFSSQYSFPCFTRQADLVHYRFGGSKDWAVTKHCVVDGDMGGIGLQDNDDGESLRHFADELNQSKKDTKLMVVISDGEPASSAQRGNGDADLHKAIEEIRGTGIDLYAIGLGTNAQRYYGEQKSVNISSRASTTELVQNIAEFVNIISVNC